MATFDSGWITFTAVNGTLFLIFVIYVIYRFHKYLKTKRTKGPHNVLDGQSYLVESYRPVTSSSDNFRTREATQDEWIRQCEFHRMTNLRKKERRGWSGKGRRRRSFSRWLWDLVTGSGHDSQRYGEMAESSNSWIAGQVQETKEEGEYEDRYQVDKRNDGSLAIHPAWHSVDYNASGSGAAEMNAVGFYRPYLNASHGQDRDRDHNYRGGVGGVEYWTPRAPSRAKSFRSFSTGRYSVGRDSYYTSGGYRGGTGEESSEYEVGVWRVIVPEVRLSISDLEVLCAGMSKNWNGMFGKGNAKADKKGESEESISTPGKILSKDDLFNI
ncbi:hypothetical protein BKA69DRAFT_1127396 [Paraphysoderma sedebokerense]|nr:hypothetical protein BKA69DRAFT_1127396 [Paraphysoderma sedebokerense]